MKRVAHYIITTLTVFVFGYLLLHSNDTLAVSQPLKKELTKEISLHFNQGKIDFNQEGIQKESVSLKTNQNFSGSSEIVRKQIPSFLLPTSLVQLELFNKNSFEVLFVKKNFLNLFLNTSRIIFPFHYFW
ncbi:hypothetical protein [Flavobacterium proteolyticum]|uniref:Uncharacterized protein n=1 Tax=Flavobacterium proteolyticum TaxID=2911683 RepID=A0ABR9WUH1_9FLAO|nr:hypothetical protein [Flavobacterium proteolyticum]MBE9577298.1 hypothetical protein [Flavobacterium proteolyticum]